VLSLVLREIRDNVVHVLALGVISILAICGLAYVFYYHMQGAALSLSLATVLALWAWFSILGTAQMYGDRANRISSLLATLAVTRERILLARVLVGVLTVLGTLAPVLLTEIVLLRIYVMPLAFYRRVAVEISITTILMGMACYCVGLAVEGTANKSWLILGNLLSLVLCVSLVIFEGCGPKAMVILLVFIAALLTRTWLKFTAASL
jgi:hypothetical protein